MEARIKKIADTVAGILFIAFVLVFIALCITVGVKNKNIKKYKTTIARQEQVIDSLEWQNGRMAAMDCVYITCNMEVKSTNVLGVNTVKGDNIVKDIVVLTRKEVLDALDSITCNKTRK